MSEIEHRTQEESRKKQCSCDNCSSNDVTSLLERFEVLENALAASEQRYADLMNSISKDKVSNAPSNEIKVENPSSRLDSVKDALLQQSTENRLDFQFTKDPKPEDEYDDRSVLSHGTFGVTHKMINNVDNGVYAVNEIKLKEANSLGLTLESLQNEAIKLQNLNHPHFVRYFISYSSRRDTFFNVVMELVSGSLTPKLTDSSVSLATKTKWLIQVASALKYLHKNSMQHRDIRPDTILLTSDESVKLLLPLVYVKKSVATDNGASDFYSSYEKANNKDYDGRDDVWAAGCVFAELLTKSRLSDRSGAVYVDNNRAKLVSDCLQVDSRMGLVISKMIEIKQSMRCTSEELLSLLSKLEQPDQLQNSHDKVCDAARMMQMTAQNFSLRPADNPSKSEWKEVRKLVMNDKIVRICAVSVLDDILVACFVSSYPNKIEIVSKSSKVTIRKAAYKNCLCFSPDGSQLAAGDSNCLKVYNSSDGNVLFNIDLSDVGSVAYSRSGCEILAGVRGSQTYVIDSRTAKVLLQLSVSSYQALLFTGDGGTLVAANFDSFVVLEGLSKIVLSFTCKSVNCCCVSVSVDGKRIMAGNVYGEILVFDITCQPLFDTPNLLLPTPLLTLAAHSDAVNSLCATQNGWLVSGSSDKTIKIWDKEFRCIHILEGHTKAVNSVTVINNYIVSGSEDETLRYWSGNLQV